jgi:hypothetical protein
MISIIWVLKKDPFFADKIVHQGHFGVIDDTGRYVVASVQPLILWELSGPFCSLSQYDEDDSKWWILTPGVLLPISEH